MKISKRQLRRIIKEELNRLVEIRDEKSPSGRQTGGGPTKPYDQGYEAGTQGNRDDMPLEKYGTPFYDAWMEGWDDGLANFHR
jgi:ribosome modulation factor